MNSYQILIPICTLFLGIMILSLMQIFESRSSSLQTWAIQLFFLILAFVQQILLYRLPSGLFLRGGMILDGTTQVFSLSALLLSILMQVNRRHRKYRILPQTSLLILGMTLFALVSIQTNRILFGVLAIMAMVWISQAALASETKILEQTNIIYSGIIRGLIFLVLGVILVMLCLHVFGETQMDEIQRVIARGQNQSLSLFGIEVLILFLGALTLGIPPFQGLFGHSRKHASWSLALGSTGLFALVGTNIFVRWALLVFTRPAIGALELEPLTNWNILHIIRIIAVVGLVLTPLLATLNTNVRGSFLFFVLNPFVQCLFALSFGQREVLGVALAQVLVAIIMIGLIMSSIQALEFSPHSSFQKWLALGRKDMMTCLSIILGLSSAAGLAPFYGSLLLQKTLSINSVFSLVLIFNIVLSGFYVGRLLTLAFHRGAEDSQNSTVTRTQRIWFAIQFILLIFMGIFWQPLYKYGAFSVRQFFGEV